MRAIPGTTTRLFAGALAAHPFATTITGDESLRRRPMKRVIEPLSRMGARFESTNGCLPLTIIGSSLTPIEFTPTVPSAQVKSAVLLAGLQTAGTTSVTRDSPYTRSYGVGALRVWCLLDRAAGSIAVTGNQPLTAIQGAVPGDPSSATFWAVAAASLPGSTSKSSTSG